MAGARPILVIKKKGRHGGHHGGAWKVAYADFVPDMMALFIVLWLMNSSKQIQEAVGGYFKDPTGTAKQVGSDMVGAGENFVVNKDNMEDLKEQLQQAIKAVPNFDKLKNQHRWRRDLKHFGGGTRQANQYPCDGRPHGLQ